MSRARLVILSLSICCVGCGCPSNDQATIERTHPPTPQAVVQRADLAAAALFDRSPGPYDASEFAIRSDWPSTVSFYSPGQVMYSRERFIDTQGPRSGGYTYHRFDSQRIAIGYR